MTPSIYLELAERTRNEIAELDDAVRRALRAWQRSREVGPDQDVYLDSVALNLHGFYSGLERMFELIARHIDQNMPTGEMWHRDLLRAMSLDVADIRPAVVKDDTREHLDTFRRFRHLVRNVYATNLVPEKMEGLMDELPELWSRLQNEMLAFASFLEDVEKED